MKIGNENETVDTRHEEVAQTKGKEEMVKRIMIMHRS